jgi:ABC-type Mn2+/Zn2+ transport system ATPase subunit
VGLIPLVAGEIRIHGLSVSAHHDCIAYIPQREEVDWKFPVLVRDVVMMGRFRKQKWFSRPSSQDLQIVQNAMMQLNIESIADRPIGDLSGGQQQRVFLARAIAQQPHILILDEPFNGVDYNTRQAILSLLTSLKSKDVTVLLSTHELNLAAKQFDRVILLNRKLIEYGDPKTVFTEQNLHQAFGNQILLLDEQHSVLVDECCPPNEEETRK